MKCVYLQRSLSINGRESLGGRRLYDALAAGGDRVLGHIVVAQNNVRNDLDPRIARDLISELAFAELGPDVVFMEDGLFSGRGSWKLERRIADEFVASGGVVVVSDVDVNTLREQREAYQEAADFLGAGAAYRDREPVLGYDERNFWKGNKQICVLVTT